MQFSSKRFIVVASLTGVLALGAVGCSSNKQAPATDDKAQTTTTTETTSTDTTTTENKQDTTDLASMTYYEIAAIGFRYDLPEGFTFSSAETDLAGKESVTAFAAADEKKDNFNVIVMQSAENTDVSSKEFLDAATKEGTAALESKNAELVDLNTGTIEVNGKTLPCVTYHAKLDGNTPVTLKQAFYVGKVDDSTYANLTMTATGFDDAVTETMFKGVSFS